MAERFDGAALMLVDLQCGMDDPRLPPRNNVSAEANAARLLGAWRAAGRRIIHVQHMSTEPDSPFRPGLPGNAIKPSLAPIADEPLFQKKVSGAFVGTSLEKHLRETGIDTLVVVGMQTDQCVSTTVRMAANLGFRTYVVNDATATFDLEGPDGTLYPAQLVHDVNIASLNGEFATIVTTDEVLASAPAALAGR
jgi:nicotinamidase-related amidase